MHYKCFNLNIGPTNIESNPMIKEKEKSKYTQERELPTRNQNLNKWVRTRYLTTLLYYSYVLINILVTVNAKRVINLAQSKPLKFYPKKNSNH